MCKRKSGISSLDSPTHPHPFNSHDTTNDKNTVNFLQPKIS